MSPKWPLRMNRQECPIGGPCRAHSLAGILFSREGMQNGWDAWSQVPGCLEEPFVRLKALCRLVPLRRTRTVPCHCRTGHPPWARTPWPSPEGEGKPSTGLTAQLARTCHCCDRHCHLLSCCCFLTCRPDDHGGPQRLVTKDQTVMTTPICSGRTVACDLGHLALMPAQPQGLWASGPAHLGWS